MWLSKMFSGDQRTVIAKKNIAGSFIIKGWSCIIQFLLVPIILKCLNQYEYGIWLTLNSMLIWIDYFDIGLGNGLRNRLTEALASDDFSRAKKLTSTTFCMLALIIIPLITLLIILIHITDCYSLFNVSPTITPNLRSILYISVILVGGTFIFKFIGNIYLGLQLPAINNLLVTAGRTLSLVGIAILAIIKDHSLLHVVFIYTLSPLLVYLVAYPITFKKYTFLRPNMDYFDKRELSGLFSLGIKFFLVQIGGAILFASSNLLISNILSPSEVTPYQICYYYFNIPLIIFTIISTPLWSATTDAYCKGEWEWIKRTEKKMHFILILIGLLIGTMIIVSPIIYRLWIGSSIHIDMKLSFFMGIYIGILIFSLFYSNILNGIGKIWLLTLMTLIEAGTFLPVAYFLGKEYGLIGIVTALIIVNSLCAVTNFIQFRKLVNMTAIGIWNK